MMLPVPKGRRRPTGVGEAVQEEMGMGRCLIVLIGAATAVRQ